MFHTDLTQANAYCQQKASQSGSSFYYSFFFLPAQKRLAITALYAFCREVDDVVDECKEASIALTKLNWWRSELARLDQGEPTHPVTKALAPYQAPFQITTARLNEIIDGMRMDLEQSRYLDFTGLRLYCYRVASVVGLMAAEIFGKKNNQTLEYAENLGIALQLTNIIRDVGEDARKGRIYLPNEDLQKFGVSPQSILQARESPEFQNLMQFQAQRARDFYRRAYAQLPDVDRSAQRTGLIMSSIYSDLLSEIERLKFPVLNSRTSLTPSRKIWIACKTWVSGRPARV
jgi:15-cis-phytoene synthase